MAASYALRASRTSPYSFLARSSSFFVQARSNLPSAVHHDGYSEPNAGGGASSNAWRLCVSVCVRVRLGSGRRRVAYALTSLQNLLYALVAAVFFGSGSTELMAIMLDFML